MQFVSPKNLLFISSHHIHSNFFRTLYILYIKYILHFNFIRCAQAKRKGESQEEIMTNVE